MNDDQQPEDQQLLDAYARLGTALAPPPDVAVRVEREVGARRRRRLTAIAGAAALVVAGAAGAAVVLGSGDDQDGDTVAVDQPGPQGSFVLTRDDGSTVEFHDFTLSCDTTPSGAPAEPGRIYLWSPFHVDDSGERLLEPYVYFEAVADRVDGKTYTLPVDEVVGDSGYPVALLFAAEGDTDGAQRPNEVSSAGGDATGTMKVLHASCGPTPSLELEVDTTLGSELSHRPSEKVEGSFG
jgi:hypothetical protein